MKYTQLNVFGNTANWPKVRYDYLLVLKQETSDLEALRPDIKFQDDHDDLDYVKVAALQSDSGNLYLLQRHRGCPGPGIYILTPNGNLTTKFTECLEMLGLSTADVTWKHDTITP